MWNAFYNPKEAIEDAKSFGGWEHTLGALFLSTVIMAIVPILWMKAFVWYVPVGALVMVPVAAFFGALLLKIALSVMDAKNPGYVESLTAISYSLAPLSVALLAAVVLGLIPYAGMILGAVVAVIGGVASMSAYLRAVVELADTDLLTAVVASWITATIGAAFGYLSLVSSIMSAFVPMMLNATG